MNKTHYTQEKGFALLLALIISSIVLSIGLSMLHITLKQLALGTTTKSSEIAFQVASAGMECLRYIRNDQSSEMYAGNDVAVECLGGQPSMSNTGDTGPNPQHTIYRDATMDWNGSCIDIEMHLLNASGGAITYTFGTVGTKTCGAGDVCTFGFVRGSNRSCGSVAAGSIFTVQRELTVEF